MQREFKAKRKMIIDSSFKSLVSTARRGMRAERRVIVLQFNERCVPMFME